MSALVYLNGTFLPRSEARVSVDDRGWVFGDGIYEVVRCVDGKLFAAEAHLDRMEDGLRGLRMAAGAAAGRRQILAVAERLLAENELHSGHASVYIQVTRGAAPRTHQFPSPDTSPTVFVAASAFVPPSDLHRRGTSAITYPDLRWARCDLKTVNLLPNVLAKQSAVAAGASEAVLLRDGVVTEGSHSNVFGVVGAQLRTHPRGNRILPGVTRAILLEIARDLGLTVRETPMLFDELADVEELFLSGTTTDVMPVVQLDGRRVGEGVPGPVTRALQEAYGALLAGAEARVV